MKTTLPRLVAGLGLLSLIASSLILCLTRFLPSEKDAVYFLGHNFDTTWEIALPAAISGALLLAVGAFLRRQTQHLQNHTSEGIRRPADGSPKPSM